MNWTVYIHITPNDKIYVGITSRNVLRRWNSGYGYLGQVFHHAIQKYGWKNIKHIIMCKKLTEKEALIMEESLISFFKSNNRKYGYNITKGGDGTSFGIKRPPRTKEHTEKLKQCQKGSKHTFTEESKKRLIDSHTGKNNVKSKPVICLNTGEIFESVRQGALKYNLDPSHLTKCCKGKVLSCGKIDNKYMYWEYYKMGGD